MEKRRRSELLSILVAVLGLHVGLLWLLMANSRIPTPKISTAALEFIYLAPGAAPASLRALPTTFAMPNEARKTARVRAQPQTKPLSVISPLQSQKPEGSVRSSDDWNLELERAARDAVAQQSAPKARSFGFPESNPTPATKAEEFGWDYVATHRIEAIPEGGILLHLNDNCVLILLPLPFMGCGIGKKPPNGQLFQHMNDPKSTGGDR